MNSPKSKAICILGMHRSGTSVITKAINLLGAYVGDEKDLLPPVEGNNPEGFWEYGDFVVLQDKILKEFGLTWDTDKPLPTGWTKSPLIRPFRERIKTIISEKFSDKPLWAWKDPRSCLLLPLWQEILEELNIDIAYVVVFRNPLDVMASLQKRDDISQDYAEKIWYNYSLTSLYDLISKQDSQRIFIQYDQFISDALGHLKEIQKKLRINSFSNVEKEGVEGLIKPDLRHSFTTQEELLQSNEISSQTKEIYNYYLNNIDLFDDDKTINYIKTQHQARLEEQYTKYATNDSIQIFWKRNDEEFEEANSNMDTIYSGPLFHKYEFELPVSKEHSIRIDPSIGYSIFEIRDIILYGIDELGEEIGIFSLDKGNTNLHITNGVIIGNTYLVLSGNDPQIYLDNITVVESFAKYKLVIDMWFGEIISPFSAMMIQTELNALRTRDEENSAARLMATEMLSRESSIRNSEREIYNALLKEFNQITATHQNERMKSSTLSKELGLISEKFEIEKDKNIVLRREINQANENISTLESTIREQNELLNTILKSKSWGLTKPLRLLSSKVKKIMK
ncbi:sulfotransferase family protein [Cohnella luojiensis]|uniref:Sulfotransferase family protein n=1 Tax=Cohnella luojiensis TaxID=652876 RepID=A0A4Y8M6J1_9BACL|nr:hypothetical protein [Cohnella luojiensis]TFE29004.1 hypothetical protein E2980_06335 [Cohnella luojiensis]